MTTATDTAVDQAPPVLTLDGTAYNFNDLSDPHAYWAWILCEQTRSGWRCSTAAPEGCLA